MDLLKLHALKCFLGADFLTWLWFESERLDGSFELSATGPLNLLVDDHLVLAAEHSDVRENVLRKGTPSACAEAGAALAVGKKVARMKLRADTDHGEFVFSLDAADLDVRGLRLPSPQTVSTTERVIERMGSLLLVTAMIDELFTAFLEVRLGRQWETEVLVAMRRWVRIKDGVVEE